MKCNEIESIVMKILIIISHANTSIADLHVLQFLTVVYSHEIFDNCTNVHVMVYTCVMIIFNTTS